MGLPLEYFRHDLFRHLAVRQVKQVNNRKILGTCQELVSARPGIRTTTHISGEVLLLRKNPFIPFQLQGQRLNMLLDASLVGFETAFSDDKTLSVLHSLEKKRRNVRGKDLLVPYSAGGGVEIGHFNA